jgi:hypothetical protein
VTHRVTENRAADDQGPSGVFGPLGPEWPRSFRSFWTWGHDCRGAWGHARRPFIGPVRRPHRTAKTGWGSATRIHPAQVGASDPTPLSIWTVCRPAALPRCLVAFPPIAYCLVPIALCLLPIASFPCCLGRGGAYNDARAGGQPLSSIAGGWKLRFREVCTRVQAASRRADR